MVVLISQSQMFHPIYAPNIYLFAYHLCENDPDDLELGQSNYNQNLLWEKCNQDIFPKFHVPQILEVTEELSGSRVDLLKGKTAKHFTLPLTGEISDENKIINITGSAQPLRIQDSYALCLKFVYPSEINSYRKIEGLDFSLLKSFNPDNILLPQSINSSLGQTILITA
ncbi:MAG TPA: hypothetical protein V6C58_19875, partial [Allocoleopsis sp.]